MFLIIYTSFPRKMTNGMQTRYQAYRALPDVIGIANPLEVNITKHDAREVIVENFFKQYQSPLADQAEQFIRVADKYALDYRLLPAIAMQESNGGKRIPKNSYNPFGYGIYAQKIMKFTSFEEAIERVGRGLKLDYVEQGLLTPEEIMAKYTPPSLTKGGAWAIGVSAFMEQLRWFDKI